MDVDVAWQELLDLMKGSDSQAISDKADDIAGWLLLRGFMPKIQAFELEFVLQWIADKTQVSR